MVQVFVQNHTSPCGPEMKQDPTFATLEADDDLTEEHIDAEHRDYEQQFLEFPNYQGAEKFMVYLCEDGCGGLADRLKGIVHAYTLSVLARRRFAIRWTNPCRLEQFLEPNLLDWRFNWNLTNNLTIKTVDYMSSYQSDKFMYETEDFDPEKIFTEDVILIRSNQEWTSTFRRLSITAEYFPAIYTLKNSDFTRIVFHGLFKYSNLLRAATDNFFKNVVKDKLACAHINMGLKGTPNYQFDDVLPILDFLNRFNESNNYKVTVVTDDIKVLRYAENRFAENFLDIFNPIEYVNNELGITDKGCSDWCETFLKHAMLSRCNVLVLTYSGFGVMAATLRQTSHGLYSFFNSHGVYPVSRENSNTMYEIRCIRGENPYIAVCSP